MGNSVNCNSYHFNENNNEIDATANKNIITCKDFYCCCKKE